MKIVKLYTDKDNKSYFKETNIKFPTKKHLGFYSKIYDVNGLMFRHFEADTIFTWHNAPQPQYIIYLEGRVEVEASGGEKRVFTSGDILFAADVTGKGHITRTLSKGKSIIILNKN